ncbi:hypothetical protein [Kineococcus rubinsiae]|uniref:hypothetical protein n=1 Tax=Kineococcus rubinsiae TaxID=2609562 RepID=UPI001430805A|nr:hypothetical protein [Kineococcus rubinsiae]NIZ93010.1 hypothetical protein [Kineococcus rubinsiae]
MEARAGLLRSRLLALPRLSLRQQNEVWEISGWLTLLISCLRHDQGDQRSAETQRRTASTLGEEVGSAALRGWGAEIAAWMALTRGDHAAVVEAVRRGLETSGNEPVAAQLHAQEAKAWARVGDPHRTELALENGRTVLDRLPEPGNPHHHFQIESAKSDFHAMDCWRVLGRDAEALAMAGNVVRAGTTAAGLVVSPMRVAEAELTRAVVAARAGAVDAALTQAYTALDRGRRSLPSLTMVAAEVADAIEVVDPANQEARALRVHLAAVASA